MDGWVTIGTKLDTKQLDKDLKNSKKELERFKNEAEKLTKSKAKLEIDTKTSEKNIENLNNKIEQSYQKLQQEKQKLASIPYWQKESPEYQKQSEIVNKIKTSFTDLVAKQSIANDKLINQKKELENIDLKLKNNANQQEILNGKIDEMNTKLKQSKGLDVVKNSIKSADSSMKSILKTVGKWAIAVFGVRSAYMFVRSSISTISQYNKQVATDIEYIRYALAMTLQPVVEGIIKLAHRLLVYIGYIAKAWFGVDLWANSSADNFERAKEGVSGTAKEAKKLQKQLAGFDEMNILQEDGSTAVGGGGGGISVPSFDLSNWEDVKIPSWIQWIAKNRNLILGTLAGIAAGVAAIKLATLLASLSGIFKILKGLSAIQLVALIGGIVIAITGIITTVKGVIGFIKDPSWTNFNKILEGLTLTLLGVGLALVALNFTNPIGWIVLATGAVAGLVTGLSTLMQSFFENKAHILSTKEAQEQLTEAINNTKEATENYANFLDEYDNAVKRVEETTKQLAEAERKNKMSGEELFNSVKNGDLTYQNMTETQKEVYKAYIANQEAQAQLKTSTENLQTGLEKLTEAKENEKKASWESELANAKEANSYDELKKKIVEAVETGKLSAEEGRDYIERAMADMSKDFAKTFTEDLPDSIKTGLEPSRYKSTWDKFKEGFGNVWDSIKSGASKFWEGLKSTFSSGINIATTFGTGGVGVGIGFAKGGVVKPIKCAKGSIISRPSRGVPLTSAIGGERGREGIIPLTDSQMMSQLGEAIGKYININLTNITRLDNRQIAREQKIINNQNDFTFNR